MRNLLLTGGPYHEFAKSAPVLACLIEQQEIDTDICDDPEEGLARAPEFDLLTFYMLRWRMLGQMFDDERDAWAGSLSPDGRDAIVEHLRRGRGVLAVHTASICFDDWAEWREVLGARWDWSRSSHPLPRRSAIRVNTDQHPIVAGIGDFEVVDEIYSYLDCADIDPLMTSDRRGEPQPLLWARDVGGGRVAYDALGHDEGSLAEPTHAVIIGRAASWAARGSV
jgi:hypothetical protein